ncbi:sugar ABC transporter ATP-binding protein [Alpinimonas psychrophila]
MANTAAVTLEGTSKSFGPIEVLSNISFALESGTVTGLVGENGAGKSTLIKILSGAIAPTSGHVLLGSDKLPSNTGAVIAAGLSVIYQELTDIPDMSLLENILLGNLTTRAGFKATKVNIARARVGLKKVGLEHLDLNAPIRNLTISQRQLAEIARCLVRDAKVLILDEPTSSLPEADVDNLLDVILALKAEGLTILYVTHHLDELFRIADRLVVLRDGSVVGDGPIGEWDEGKLVRAMLAKDLAQAYPWVSRKLGSVTLEGENLVARGVRGSSVHIKSKEIVGLVGLAGAGRTELMRVLTGVEPFLKGNVTVGGKPLKSGRISSARALGVLYGPEDRKQEGLVLGGSIESNLAYGSYHLVSRFGFLNLASMHSRALFSGQKFSIKFRSPTQAVGELSGGNQQKVVLARISQTSPVVVCFDDPTRGVDVGAKSGIYEHIFDLASNGTSIFMTSSDTDEILAVADRVYVLAGGRIVGELLRSEFDRQHILHLASRAAKKKEI